MFSGVRQITYAGYSMYPSLRPGDVLVVRQIPPNEIRLGDILCLPEGGSYVSHRVVHMQINENRCLFKIKGDNLTGCAHPMEIIADPILKVIMIKRPGRGLITPRHGTILALLSRKNLTYGIIKGKLGKLLKHGPKL